jgi:7,8-dihydropterin-6-yl-methyl-4-(beta-D-ribofuranosyl)aminobenzene 5'-phosphate synthase
MVSRLKLTVLCENSVFGPAGLIGEHGWACYIECAGYNILFDTGQGLGILSNSLILKKDLRNIDFIVLSHGHYDHTSGLPTVLGMSGSRPVYAHPDIFLTRYYKKGDTLREIGLRYKKDYLETLGAVFVDIKEFTEIYQDIYVTGVVPRINNFEPPDPNMQLRDEDKGWMQDPLKDDFSLVIDTKEGLFVILGCAHAGIINILDHIQKNLYGRPIHTVIGGTHLGFAAPAQFDITLSNLEKFGIKRLGAAHCTGLENAAKLYNALGKKFFFASAGTSVSI